MVLSAGVLVSEENVTIERVWGLACVPDGRTARVSLREREVLQCWR